MKRLALPLALTVALLGALAASTADAADMRRPVFKAPPIVPPPFSWTGFYIGGFGGGGGGSEDPVDLNEYAGQTITNGTGHFWLYDMDPSFIAGGTIGFNYQVGQWVFGIEGEGGYIHLRGGAPDPRSPGLDVVSNAELGDWYGIIAGRIGYAFDRTLVYAKGGAVFTDVRATVSDSCVLLPCGPVTILATGGTDVVSWVAGVGIEYAFTNNWSVKLEYLYWGLDESFLVTGVASNGATYSWLHEFTGLHTVKLGVNFRFGPT
jgi:outer membrane immunogenic protein